MVVFIIMRLNAELVVAAVTQGCADCATGVFHRFPVERQHNFSVGCVGIADSVFIFDHFDTVSQRLLIEAPLVGPRTIE